MNIFLKKKPSKPPKTPQAAAYRNETLYIKMYKALHYVNADLQT